MEREELITKLEGLRPDFEQAMIEAGSNEPDWKPLEMVLPMKWCDGFMYMGCFNGVHEYKHGLTRRTLALDADGHSYRYDSKNDRHVEIPLDLAIDRVYEDIEEMG
ncbi:MAG: hypothetical protein LC808_42880, partial [Actinobacteria bacterium]|nr:hypothetical protein [Actinomycetota bacterium]